MNTKTNNSKGFGLTVIGPQEIFRFSCHDGLECFTSCCRDTAVFLTPYDVLRLKNALGISSGAFLKDYTIRIGGGSELPIILLKMGDDEAKSCPFITEKGCMVYPDRPWSCRIYPLRPETTPNTKKTSKQYYSVMKVPFCQGLKQNQTSTVEQWLEQQGITIYSEMEMFFLKSFKKDGKTQEITNRQIREMCYMACYDSDRFRHFLFESSFFDRFETNPAEIDRLRSDDVALYKFAMRWLEFGLLNQQSFKVKPKILTAAKEKLGIR